MVPTFLTTSHLSLDQGEAVGRQNLIDGLEVGRAARAAVARASRGDTLGLGTGVEGAARVAGLGADVGLGEAGDTSLGVVDRRAQGADCATVDTSGGAGAADAGAGGRRGAARDGQVARAVSVDGAREGGSADGADVGHVSASWEDGGREGSERPTAAAGGGSAACGATVASRDEASGDREADGAPSSLVDVVGIATADRGEGGRQVLNCLHLELASDEANLRGQGLGVGGAVGERLQDELVGGDVDVVRGDARGGRLGASNEGAGLLDVDVVECVLSLLELPGAVGHDSRGGASSGDVGGQGCVSDGNVECAVLGRPGTGERVTRHGLQLLDGLGSGDVPGDTSMGLLGVEAQVTLHGGQDLRVEAVRGLRGCTVGDGQDGCQEGEELDELHV